MNLNDSEQFKILKRFQNLNFLMINKFIKKFIQVMIFLWLYHMVINFMHGLPIIKKICLYVN